MRRIIAALLMTAFLVSAACAQAEDGEEPIVYDEVELEEENPEEEAGAAEHALHRRLEVAGIVRRKGVELVAAGHGMAAVAADDRGGLAVGQEAPHGEGLVDGLEVVVGF